MELNKIENLCQISILSNILQINNKIITTDSNIDDIALKIAFTNF